MRLFFELLQDGLLPLLNKHSSILSCRWELVVIGSEIAIRDGSRSVDVIGLGSIGIDIVVAWRLFLIKVK